MELESAIIVGATPVIMIGLEWGRRLSNLS